MAPVLLSSFHSSLTLCSGTVFLAGVHAVTTRSSPAPCSARVSLVQSAVASRRCSHTFRWSRVSFGGFSATAPSFVVRNQADTTKPMDSDKICKIFSGTAHPKMSEDIASRMNTRIKIKPVKGCGKNVKLPEIVQDCHVYLLQPICPPGYNNEELLTMIDACKAGKARSITIVMPFATKVRGRELFNHVKEVACELDPDHGVHETLSFDFSPMLANENPPPNTIIDAKSIMRHYLEHVHESDLVVVSSQNSEDTSSSFKKDFQLLAVIDNVRHEDTTAREDEFIGDVDGHHHAILIENALHTNGVAFLRSRGTKNVYTSGETYSVPTAVAKFLTDATSLHGPVGH